MDGVENIRVEWDNVNGSCPPANKETKTEEIVAQAQPSSNDPHSYSDYTGSGAKQPPECMNGT